MTILQVSILITAITSLTLGVFVYLSNRKEKINQFWFLTTLFLTLWSVGYFGVITSKNETSALFWQYVLDEGGIFIPIVYFNFILYLLNLDQKYKFQRKFSWILGGFLFILSFTSLFKIGVSPKFGFNYWIDPGSLYFLFPLVLTFYLSYAFFLLFREHSKTGDAILKGRIKYIIGAQIFGFGGGISNFFPQFFGVYPFGNYFLSLYVFFISYAIFKHHLFNIKVIATELITFALWVFILIRTLLANTYRELLINGSLFLLMIGFGILLIRSVLKEVEQREKLEVLTKELEDKNIKLQELDKVRSEFLSFASHQVKAPMTVVKGFASMIYDGTLGQVSDKIREAAQKIQISAERLIALVNNLLDLRRIEEGKMEFNFEKTEINDLISGLVEEFKILAKNKGLELIFKPPSEKIFISADPQKFRQVIQNLIDNAIKYTEKGWVKVKIEKENKKNVLISISDSGRGIPKELFPNLFKQFSRDHELAKELQGTGLGLYIAKQIIDAHQGQIRAESPGQNQGSAFYVKIPIGSFNKIEI